MCVVGGGGPIFFRRPSAGLEARVDHAVGLQGGDENVEDPEEHKDAGGDGLDGLGPAQLASDGGTPPREEDEDCQEGLDTEHSHGEAQAEIL